MKNNCVEQLLRPDIAFVIKLAGRYARQVLRQALRAGKAGQANVRQTLRARINK